MPSLQHPTSLVLPAIAHQFVRLSGVSWNEGKIVISMMIFIHVSIVAAFWVLKRPPLQVERLFAQPQQDPRYPRSRLFYFAQAFLFATMTMTTLMAQTLVFAIFYPGQSILDDVCTSKISIFDIYCWHEDIFFKIRTGEWHFSKYPKFEYSALHFGLTLVSAVVEFVAVCVFARCIAHYERARSMSQVETLVDEKTGLKEELSKISLV